MCSSQNFKTLMGKKITQNQWRIIQKLKIHLSFGDSFYFLENWDLKKNLHQICKIGEKWSGYCEIMSKAVKNCESCEVCKYIDMANTF